MFCVWVLVAKEFLVLLEKVPVWLLHFQFPEEYPSSPCGLQVSIPLWWFIRLLFELQCCSFPELV